MKIIFLIIFSAFTLSAYCQIDVNNIAVQEINVADTAFNQHPVSTGFNFLSLNDTYDSVYVQIDITMKSQTTDPQIISHKANNTYVLLVPLTQYKAAFKNSTISYTYADAILQRLKLKSVH